MINSSTIYCTTETQITFWCQMRFHLYPLDTHICKFRLGSFAFNRTQLSFTTKKLYYNGNEHNTVLDYSVFISHLKDEDKFYNWEEGIGNFSLAGFELRLKRHSLKYFFNYYLPSGLFVVVSWVSIAGYTVQWGN